MSFMSFAGPVCFLFAFLLIFAVLGLCLFSVSMNSETIETTKNFVVPASGYSLGSD